ncbi:Fungal specific transcription factor domain [Ceratobasidium sp. AG-Ba]|nr:Fungal specific transcription factor domain [Ceratobasidium sp. AG-Ba]QRW07528.1 hypothetical protein RhiLY_06527 [Ceratobasidium sp. AG-Ba]
MAELGFSALDVSDEDIQQSLPGTLYAFESGASFIEDSQERQTALSTDLFTTHRDNLDDFGLYIKVAIMLSRIHVMRLRYLTVYETEQEVRDSEEMEVMETIISSMKSSTMKGRFSLKEQPSADAVSNLYMTHTSAQLATLVCHVPLANWSDPSCESANKALGAARAILRHATTLVSSSWDLMRLDKAATLSWYMSGKALALALAHAPESLAPMLRAEIGLVRRAFLSGGNRVMLFARQLHGFERDLVEILGEKEVSMLFQANGF